MRKIVVVMSAVLSAVSLLAVAPAHAQESGSAELEQEFVGLLNDLRVSEGLPALTVHEELVAKARRWSATMAAAGDIWHSELAEGITAPWRRLGENVGMGGSVRALHDAFVASPHHFENLVDPRFSHVGIGVVVDQAGTIFVSQEFMEVAPTPAPTAPSGGAGADGTDEVGHAGTPVSFRLTDPVPAPTLSRAHSDGGRPAPAGKARDNDDVTRVIGSDDGTSAPAMQPVVLTVPTGFSSLAAILLLTGVASGLRHVAARRVARRFTRAD